MSMENVTQRICSGSTCHKRFQEWRESSIFDNYVVLGQQRLQIF